MNFQSHVGAFVAASTVFVAAAVAWAAVPPRSIESLTESAAVIIQGQIVSVTSTVVDTASDGTNRIYTAKIAIQCVEKGEGVAVGTTVAVQSWATETRPAGWAGHQGGPVPTTESYVRAYLTVDEGAYHLIPPNGLTTLEPTVADDGTATLPCPPTP